MAAAVRMRRRSSRQMGFQAAMKRETPGDDDVFESPIHAAETVASPKMTPSRERERFQPVQKQEYQEIQQEAVHQLLGPEPAQQQSEQEQQEIADDEEEQSQSQPKQEVKQESEEESREAEEPVTRECPRPLFKRKNSYRAAQEKNPIAGDEFWYVDKDPNRERTRSSGNLFDDERYYERQMARSVNSEQKNTNDEANLNNSPPGPSGRGTAPAWATSSTPGSPRWSTRHCRRPGSPQTSRPRRRRPRPCRSSRRTSTLTSPLRRWRRRTPSASCGRPTTTRGTPWYVLVFYDRNHSYLFRQT